VKVWKDAVALLPNGQHMKIRRINDFGSTFIHPEFFFDSLTVCTVPVAAGIVMVFDVTAIGTLADRCT